jgi:hypothetical protein
MKRGWFVLLFVLVIGGMFYSPVVKVEDRTYRIDWFHADFSNP